MITQRGGTSDYALIGRPRRPAVYTRNANSSQSEQPKFPANQRSLWAGHISEALHFKCQRQLLADIVTSTQTDKGVVQATQFRLFMLFNSKIFENVDLLDITVFIKAIQLMLFPAVDLTKLLSRLQTYVGLSLKCHFAFLFRGTLFHKFAYLSHVAFIQINGGIFNFCSCTCRE